MPSGQIVVWSELGNKEGTAQKMEGIVMTPRQKLEEHPQLSRGALGSVQTHFLSRSLRRLHIPAHGVARGVLSWWESPEVGCVFPELQCAGHGHTNASWLPRRLFLLSAFWAPFSFLLTFMIVWGFISFLIPFISCLFLFRAFLHSYLQRG